MRFTPQTRTRQPLSARRIWILLIRRLLTVLASRQEARLFQIHITPHRVSATSDSIKVNIACEWGAAAMRVVTRPKGAKASATLFDRQT